MDISDIIMDSNIPLQLRTQLLEFIDQENISDLYLRILKPTESNDDVNGSQHASNGGTDFTYEDADVNDIVKASAFGYYEYFRDMYAGVYTGHSYQGYGQFFSAIVVDPPAYAATFTVT